MYICISQKDYVYICFLFQNHQLNIIQSKEESSHKPNTIMTIFCTGFSTPEKKLFILFWYYILVSLIFLTFFTIYSQTANSIVEHLHDYFSCSIAGYKPECEVYKKQVESVTWSSFYLDLASTLLLCSITLSNLTYVLQFYHIKKFVLKLFASRT